MGKRIATFRELEVYQMAFKLAMELFTVSKTFPREERYSLTDQIRRSSRSVCANIAEAFLKRNYPAAFVGRLSDSVTEAAETQVWIDFASECGYIDPDMSKMKNVEYAQVIGKLIVMMNHPEHWRI